jgi:N,N-dimethylformamidase beta subunit-like protein
MASASDTPIGSRRGLGRALRIVTAAGLAALLLGVVPVPAGSHTDDEELEGRAPTAAELRPSVEAAFPRESYAPGSSASLVIFNAARGVELQLFRSGPEKTATRRNDELRGVAVTPRMRIGDSSGRRAVELRVGGWPSGLYFARLSASDGRVGFAPFVVRPRRVGEHRVAVVLPTMTWQAYNLRDDDGDGRGDSWYACWNTHTARLGRPYLNRGVPYNFRRYDMPFLRWTSATRPGVDFLSDSDLDGARSGDALADAYDLIVFPGHHEYVTTHEYDVVERYRDLGGNLMFLSANNFFWRVVKRGNVIEKTEQWRDLGRPEAALLGVQYRGNDGGGSRGPWILKRAPAASWVFAATGLKSGSAFSTAGIEIDRTSSASPPGVQVVAEIKDLFGPGFTAQMTYYETPAGAKVFAAGAFTLAGRVDEPQGSTVVGNLWAKLSQP